VASIVFSSADHHRQRHKPCRTFPRVCEPGNDPADRAANQSLRSPDTARRSIQPDAGPTRRALPSVAKPMASSSWPSRPARTVPIRTRQSPG